MSKHEITWEAEDGYLSGSRPQTLVIRTGYFDPGMTLEGIELGLSALVQADFERTVSWSSRNLDAVAQAIFDELQAQETE